MDRRRFLLTSLAAAVAAPLAAEAQQATGKAWRSGRRCPPVTPMGPGARLSQLWASLLLCLVLAVEPVAALPNQVRLEFVDADIRVVVEEVARITGMTFLFDRSRVKGKITVLAPEAVSPAQALELLRSALALHGYAFIVRPESTWIVPAADVAHAGFVVKVVPLKYANAGEVALTLSRVAPPGVRIVPYRPTNSVLISGRAAAVDQMVDIIQPR
jgi:general secretion pathway protein D